MYRLEIPPTDLDALRHIDWAGNVGELRIDGRVATDRFWDGSPWTVNLRDAGWRPGAEVTLHLLPLAAGSTVLLLREDRGACSPPTDSCSHSVRCGWWLARASTSARDDDVQAVADHVVDGAGGLEVVGDRGHRPPSARKVSRHEGKFAARPDLYAFRVFTSGTPPHAAGQDHLFRRNSPWPGKFEAATVGTGRMVLRLIHLLG